MPARNNNDWDLIKRMRSEYNSGNNVMHYIREIGDIKSNQVDAIQVAYDLQAGSYIEFAKADMERSKKWCKQAATILSNLVKKDSTLLEVGCGEATTLQGVLKNLEVVPKRAFGFDISWSRCFYANGWLKENKQCADVFVADLFAIPLADSSIDVVYSSHSLEPNGGNEQAALKELVRVARKAIVLIEPIYELASLNAKARMVEHGYVKNLKNLVESLGLIVSDYRLLDFIVNPLNPSGVIVIEKDISKSQSVTENLWRCPLTKTPLDRFDDCFFSKQTGLAYPILRGIPILHGSHSIIASSYLNTVL